MPGLPGIHWHRHTGLVTYTYMWSWFHNCIQFPTGGSLTHFNDCTSEGNPSLLYLYWNISTDHTFTSWWRVISVMDFFTLHSFPECSLGLKTYIEIYTWLLGRENTFWTKKTNESVGWLFFSFRMISSKFALIVILILINCASSNPVSKDKKVSGPCQWLHFCLCILCQTRREGGRNGSCSKEECSNGRKIMKISSDCIKAPFCVRQFVRDLKKTVKEKVRSDGRRMLCNCSVTAGHHREE